MYSVDVSIVLPTYNGQKYLQKAVDSILMQNFTNWELIAVDDCSTDETGAILEEYAARNSRIKVIHNRTNQKLPASLNIGFREASGKYLTWTSDDNRYHPSALYRMKALLDTYPEVYLTYAKMRAIDSSGRESDKNEGFYRYEPERLILHNVIGACFMYRREVLDEVGEYDTNLFCVEDYDYWLRIAERYPIRHIPEVLYDYRLHDGSLTETKKEKIRSQRRRLREIHIDFTLSSLKNRPADLCGAFFSYLSDAETVNETVYEKFRNALPELKCFINTLPTKRIVLWGAGVVGSRAAKALGDKVAAFADNDISKIGSYKERIPILPFDEIMDKDVDIVISVGSDKIYEVITQMVKRGVHEYRVWQVVANQLNDSR